jgi:hypothetical protein
MLKRYPQALFLSVLVWEWNPGLRACSASIPPLVHFWPENLSSVPESDLGPHMAFSYFSYHLLICDSSIQEYQPIIL